MHLSRSEFEGGKKKEKTPATIRSCVCSALMKLMALTSTSLDGTGISHRAQRQEDNSRRRGQSKLRRKTRNEFLKTAVSVKDYICDPESLPPLDSAYSDFLRLFPSFADTSTVDEMRRDEYVHLNTRVCLDYSGFGLFSHLQRVLDHASSSFRLSYVSANLPTHALYGVAEESSLEGYIRRRIMEYFRLSENDYCMVFTASKGSAVKLLAESYRFDNSGRLVTAYDHRSQSIEWMIECARQKGARVSTGTFRWPSLRICSKELKKQLVEKKVRKDSSKGLFVFPLQSRVTGAKYSYQWIPLAQQNQWHVFLDASALGPRDMDALGVSLFSPDFIVSSFYKVFGSDPSGFGCLFIKKSSISCLYNSSKARAVGVVKLLPLSSAAAQEEHETHHRMQQDLRGFDLEIDPSNVSSFSGPLSIEHESRDLSMEDPTTTRDASDRIVQASTSAVGNGATAAVERSVAGKVTGTITLIYPSEAEKLKSCESSRRFETGESSKREFQTCESSRRFETGESSKREFQTGESSRRFETGESSKREFPTGESSRRFETGESSKREFETGESSTTYTLKELLRIPEPELSGNQSGKSEESVICKALDQTKLLGMSMIRRRMRYLITWLVMSLIKLRHPTSDNIPLVEVYGPGRKYDRGASLAFNLYAWDGVLLQPTLVQKLADRNSISLGLAEIKNVDLVEASDSAAGSSSGGRKSNSSAGGAAAAAPASAAAACICSGGEFMAVTVVLSYVSNFEDVYKLWGFIARFLDADFVNKEVWRYHSLNQEIVVLR